MNSHQPSPNAIHSGTFSIGGITPIHRLGYGAAQITGKGIWGDHPERQQNLDTLRRLPELGVNFIDTADSYGPGISEDMIREALHPYGNTVIATKGGTTRPSPDLWTPCGRPEYLKQQAYLSRYRLGVERIDLWQLHRIDPQVPADEQFQAVQELIQEGVIQHAGLSEVNIQEIETAQHYFPVATVQNLYNLVNRQSEDILNYCEKNHIGFIPWFPLAHGTLVQPGGILSQLVNTLKATPSQIVLAWLLKRSPVLIPIPGTGKVKHLEENVAAASLQLSDEDFATLNELGRTEWQQQNRATARPT